MDAKNTYQQLSFFDKLFGKIDEKYNMYCEVCGKETGHTLKPTNNNETYTCEICNKRSLYPIISSLADKMSSIIKCKRGEETMKPVSNNEKKERSRVTKEEWREFTKTVWQIANTTHALHPAVFPKEIPHRLIKLFSYWGETILDPFAGVGTTAVAALELGRNVICVEQNPIYIEEIEKVVAQTEYPDHPDVKICLGDSRKLELQDGSVDLVITSPPYWNKAHYGEKKENLGNIEGYRQFFEEIEPVFRECYRIVKPGRKVCIVTANVNQYTEYGLLSFPLAADFIVLLRDLGFLFLSEVIWSKNGTGGKWGSYGAQRPIFGSYPFPPNFLFKTIHEHILIFIKPPQERKTGNKVKLLDDIMRVSPMKSVT